MFSGACCIVHTDGFCESCESLLLTFQQALKLFQSGIHPLIPSLPAASITTLLSIATAKYRLPASILKLPSKSWKRVTQLLCWWDWKLPITLTRGLTGTQSTFGVTQEVTNFSLWWIRDVLTDFYREEDIELAEIMPCIPIVLRKTLEKKEMWLINWSEKQFLIGLSHTGIPKSLLVAAELSSGDSLIIHLSFDNYLCQLKRYMHM